MVNWIWVVMHSIDGEGDLFCGAYQARGKATKKAQEIMAEINCGKADFKEVDRERTTTQWSWEDHMITIQKVRVK